LAKIAHQRSCCKTPSLSKSRYIADGTLNESCSFAELELRSLLDSPNGIRFLLQNTKDQECHRFIGLWFACREWVQSDEDKLSRLLEICKIFKYLTFQHVAEHSNSNEVIAETSFCWCLADRLSSSICETMASSELDAYLNIHFRLMQRACFQQLLNYLFIPFSKTIQYEHLGELNSVSKASNCVNTKSFEYGRVLSQGV